VRRSSRLVRFDGFAEVGVDEGSSRRHGIDVVRRRVILGDLILDGLVCRLLVGCRLFRRRRSHASQLPSVVLSQTRVQSAGLLWLVPIGPRVITS